MALWLLLLFIPVLSFAQIDPVKRDLIQVGYNAVFEGVQPFSGYAFYYHNEPNFYKTNLTMRIALSPTYMDSELGVSSLLGPNTDVGFGLAGGGFADNYNEIHQGTYLPEQSFNGYGAEGSMGIYHLLDPGRRIPLELVLRGTLHYTAYGNSSDTAHDFTLPNNHIDGSVRAGIRFGGVEPTLFPPLAMELSIWYEGHVRSNPGPYGSPVIQPNGSPGFPANLNRQSQLFWTEAALSYTFSNTQQNVYIRMTAGTSVDADKLSCYRLGSFLPLIAEFPLSLPGYFYQEISAKQFVLLNANYLIPLDKNNQWDLAFNASTAAVDYLPGESQPGNWLNGVAGGVMWHSSNERWKVMANYAYGFNAIRNDHHGANSVGFLLQIDLGKAGKGFTLTQPSLWQGAHKIFQ